MAMTGGLEKICARTRVLLEQTAADELIFTCDLYEFVDRLRAFDLLASLRWPAAIASWSNLCHPRPSELYIP